MGWTAGVRSQARATDFSLFYSVQTDAGAHLPPIQWVPGVLSPVVNRQGREANHSPPSSAEVKNGGAIPPFLHMASWNMLNKLGTRPNLPYSTSGDVLYFLRIVLFFVKDDVPKND
jgi:hypothetical protein